ncbi:MAG: hypothetical protein IJU76_00870 [Desulfovibrionaceae bacterium]|nr:hypothetical protein [Desulfovibrionaceae bacterium]
MANVVKSGDIEVRAHWKRIAIKDKLIGNPTLADLLLSGTFSVDEPYYLLYNNQPYCFFEGAMYQMLPVEDPSIGYKLVDSTVDRKTVLAQATGITETEAIDAMFLLMK